MPVKPSTPQEIKKEPVSPRVVRTKRRRNSKFSFDDYDNVIGYLIHQAATNLSRRFSQGLTEAGVDLTPREFPILNRLHQYRLLTQSQISDFTYNDRPNMSRLLDALITRGLVQKAMDQQDRRAFLVSLTDKGRIVRDEAVAVLTDILEEVCETLSTEQISTTLSTLRHIVDMSR